MSSIERADVNMMSIDEISNKLESSTNLHEEMLKEERIILQEVNEVKDGLKIKERLIEKQNSRLNRLKCFIEKEQEQKEQLEATMSQNVRPPNLKEKICNINTQIKRYKQEEEKLIRDHFSTLETVRNLNASIIRKTEYIKQYDLKLSSLKKDITVLKHGLNKLKLAQ